jgi:hypothetical protein
VEVDPDRVLDFAQALLAWADGALLTIAAAHRRAELELARREQEDRADLVRGVLFGTIGPADMRGQFESYGVDPRASTWPFERGRRTMRSSVHSASTRRYNTAAGCARYLTAT